MTESDKMEGLMAQLDPTMKKAVFQLAETDAIKTLVSEVAGLPETTKDHYGDWMVHLTEVRSAMGWDGAAAVAIACVLAGGSHDGIFSAIRLMGMPQ